MNPRRHHNLNESWNKKIGSPDGERPDEMHREPTHTPSKPDHGLFDEMKRTVRKVVDRIKR